MKKKVEDDGDFNPKVGDLKKSLVSFGIKISDERLKVWVEDTLMISKISNFEFEQLHELQLEFLSS